MTVPQPELSQVHINRWATEFAVRYRQEKTNFVALQVFPACPTEKKSNEFLKYPKGYFMRDDMTVRGMNQEPAEAGYEVESGTFVCEERALQHKIDDRIDVNADAPLNPTMRATEWLEEKSLVKLDREWAEEFFSAGKWTTTWEGTSGATKETEHKVKKFTLTEGEPIPFFSSRADDMEEKTGKRPNVMVLGARAYTLIRNNKSVVERVQYISQQEPALVGRRALAAAFEVDKVVVAKSVYNSAQEGAEDDIEYIANPKSALLAYATDAPSLDTASAGYVFTWTSLLPGISNATAGVIFSGREDKAFTDWYAIRSAYDIQQTAPDLGVFFNEII
jgi:hypothetical protein